MLGKTLRDLNCLKRPPMLHTAVKTPTFSFVRLRGADPALGVEMTSTGEVACLDYDFPVALIKSLVASGLNIPLPHSPVLITVRKEDHEKAASLARRLEMMGYSIYATEGTAKAMKDAHLKNVNLVKKISEGEDNVTDFIIRRKPGLVVNVPSAGRKATVTDGYRIRRAATEMMIPVITQMETAEALVSSLEKGGLDNVIRVRSLNEFLSSSQWAKEV
jgi:carbamoyl-phosphate synthase large subunit